MIEQLGRDLQDELQERFPVNASTEPASLSILGITEMLRGGIALIAKILKLIYHGLPFRGQRDQRTFKVQKLPSQASPHWEMAGCNNSDRCSSELSQASPTYWPIGPVMQAPACPAAGAST